MHFSCWEKLGFGLLIAAWTAFASNFAGNALIHADPLEKSAYQVVAVENAEAAAAISEDAAVEDVLTLLASVDSAQGEKAFKKCKACHSVAEGAKHKVGPNLWDIVGRQKAGVGGFGFSGALKDKGGDWSYEDLDQFLLNPKAYAKGTKMSFAGVKKAGDRAAIIQYLRSLSASPKPLP